MTFVRVSPAKKFKRSTSIFNELFNELLTGNFTQPQFVNNRPAANVIENKDGFRIELIAPGLSKEDFSIDLDKDTLTISADTPLENKEQEKVLRRSFAFNKFKRTFRLPDTIDKEQISASFENGVLSVTLSKEEEAKVKAPRTIAIK